MQPKLGEGCRGKQKKSLSGSTKQQHATTAGATGATATASPAGGRKFMPPFSAGWPQQFSGPFFGDSGKLRYRSLQLPLLADDECDLVARVHFTAAPPARP